MSDLSRSLVDAAAQAVCEAIDGEPHHRRLYPDLYSDHVARAAVVAVLETLAAAEKTYGVGTLLALAVEVKGDGQ